MNAALSRALVALAVRSLGDEQSDWGRAMEAEFESALDDGRPLAFAVGCLVGSWRRMPASEEGRFMLAGQIVALGLLVPAAAMLVWQTLTDRIVAPSPGNLCALPALAAVSLFLAAGHVRLAWLVLDRDWDRATRLGMLNAASSTTLVSVAGAMLLCDLRLLLDASITAAGLGAVAVLAQWHAQLPGRARRRSSA